MLNCNCCDYVCAVRRITVMNDLGVFSVHLFKKNHVLIINYAII